VFGANMDRRPIVVIWPRLRCLWPTGWKPRSYRNAIRICGYNLCGLLSSMDNLYWL